MRLTPKMQSITQPWNPSVCAPEYQLSSHIVYLGRTSKC